MQEVKQIMLYNSDGPYRSIFPGEQMSDGRMPDIIMGEVLNSGVLHLEINFEEPAELATTPTATEFHIHSNYLVEWALPAVEAQGDTAASPGV